MRDTFISRDVRPRSNVELQMRGPKLQFDSIQTGKLDLWVKFEFSLTNTFYPFSFGRTKYKGIYSVESKVELIMNLVKFVSREGRRLTWALV